MKPSILQDDTHTAFRRSVQDMIEEHIASKADNWRKEGVFPEHLLKLCGDKGFLGISQPTELGGGGRDFWHEVVLAEELARCGVTGWTLSVLAQTNMLIPLLKDLAKGAKQKDILTSAIAGEYYIGLAATEPTSGSDMVNISTEARAENNSFVLNGEKQYITNGSVADYVIVLAKTTKEKTADNGPWSLSLILVDTSLSGVKQKHLDTIGLKTGDTGYLSFSDVVVPEDQLLGQKSRGLPYLLDGLQRERLIGAVAVVALADQVLERTLDYLQETNRYQEPLTEKQVIRHRLVEMRAKLESARQFTYNTCAAYQQGDGVDEEILMLKIHAYQTAQDIISRCAHLHGARSFLADSWISHILRDSQAFTFAAGTPEVMRDLLSKHMQI